MNGFRPRICPLRASIFLQNIIFIGNYFLVNIINRTLRMRRETLGLILALMLLIANIGTVNWQGTGNLTRENITIIRTYIDTNFYPTLSSSSLQAPGDKTFADLATGLSDQLNNQWAPAWNVVIAFSLNSADKFDTVLYGYGFRDHWMWDNSYKISEGQTVGFIIWKDYNCINWITYNQNNGVAMFMSSFSNVKSGSVVDAVYQIAQNGQLDMKNVWLSAKAISDKIYSYPEVVNNFETDKSFTVIASQAFSLKYYARVCVKDYLRFGYQLGVDGQYGKWGHALILQMR